MFRRFEINFVNDNKTCFPRASRVLKS